MSKVNGKCHLYKNILLLKKFHGILIFLETSKTAVAIIFSASVNGSGYAAHALRHLAIRSRR